MNTTAVVYKVITIFLLLCAGFVARKCRWIDDRVSRGLSAIVICVGQPFMIVSKVIAVPYSQDNLITGAQILLLSFGIHLALALLAHFAVLPVSEKAERGISEYALLFVNCGFAGIPLLEAAFGTRGAFWGAFYVIAYNLIQWSYGMVLLGKIDPDIRMNFKKAILNYGTVPCIVGLVLFATGVGQKLPTPLTDAMNLLGSLCTPLSMIVIGGIVATIPFRNLFTNGKVYFVCALKLIALPLAVTLIAKAIGLPDEYVLFASIVSALPTATNTGVFAEKYDIIPQYASHLVGMTTVLSAASVPLVVLLAEKIIAIW